MENFEQNNKKFIFPDIDEEIGEVERVARHFSLEGDFVEHFIDVAKRTQLTILSEDIWSELENTDSKDIKRGDWDAVEYNSEQVKRDWRDLKQKLEKGISINAPIILKYGDRYHLVSGNTRLMVSRAAGITP